MVVLHLLSSGERYGYEIVALLEDVGRGYLTIKEGTLYPILYRLEHKGFVVTRWDTQARGVPRKFYSITPDGITEAKQQRKKWEKFVRIVSHILNGVADK